VGGTGTAGSLGDIAVNAGGSITVQSGGVVTTAVNVVSYSTAGGFVVNQGGTLTTGSGIVSGNGVGTSGAVIINGTANTGTWDAIAGWEQSAGTLTVGSTGVLNTRSLLAAHNTGANGTITVDGQVNATGAVIAGWSGTGATGTINVNAGAVVNADGFLEVGGGWDAVGYAAGIVNMNGGSMTVTGLDANTYTQNVTTLNWDWVGGEATINLNAGELWVDGSIGGFQEHGLIDIEEGATLYLLGDATNAMNWYVSLGTLTANDGTGTIVIDYNNTQAGYTTITAIPEPATLGMLALMGGGMLWIRKRFMIYRFHKTQE
jgi:hypothetical protein